jgi:hypothetical protein
VGKLLGRLRRWENNIKMYLREIGSMLDGTGSESYLMVGFGISSVEPLGSAAT